MARDYIAKGLTRDRVLEICDISKYRYYNDPTGKKGGVSVSTTTIKIDARNELVEVSNVEVIDEMVKVKSNPERDYGY